MSGRKKFPISVKSGSAEVKIYRTHNKGQPSFVVAYYEGRTRKRHTFSALSEAEREAKQLAQRLNAGDHGVIHLRGPAQAAYQRAMESLGPLGVSIDAAAVEYAQAKLALGSTSLSEAVEFYRKKHPSNIRPRMVAAIIPELIEALKQDRKSPGYVKHLAYDLDQFAKAFKVEAHCVTRAEVEDWLRSLKVATRTRRNLLASATTLVNFAKARGYVPKDFDEVDSIPKPKVGGGDIVVFTPEEMRVLLSHAKPELIPYLALAGFAGIRHAEIQRLDWQDFRFEDGRIEVPAAKAKTASRRPVKIRGNLAGWLQPYRREEGPVCPFRNMASELDRLVKSINEAQQLKDKRSRFVWKRNGLRHAFISYLVELEQDVPKVAYEAGTSPQMVFRHYRNLASPRDAKQWFEIVPTKEINVIPMAESATA